jgi:potassium large conductance calcium-activated channel subfamily M alpha protein 1
MLIKNFLAQNKVPNIKICMQLLKPEGISHYNFSIDQELTKIDQTICVEQMKYSLMAKSCICPGLATMITNLIKSASEQSFNSKDSNWTWLKDYNEGKTFEIYKQVIPPNFVGQTFCSIANEIYKEDGLLLFALRIAVNDE